MKTIAFALGVVLASCSAAYAGSVTLFTLNKSSNANQVVYELRDGAKPSDTQWVHPYWRMTSTDGHTEELTRIERRIYGIETVGTPNDGSFQFAIAALSSVTLTAWTHPAEGHAYASLKLGGQVLVLKRLYVHQSRGLFPGVASVDLEVADAAGALHYFNLVQAGSGFKSKPVRCPAEWAPCSSH